MALVVHPYIMGAPHRLKYLRRVFEVIRSKERRHVLDRRANRRLVLGGRTEGAVTVHEHREGMRAAKGAGDVQARLMLVALCLIWGFTWPVMKIALNEIPPLSMRTATAGIGAFTLLLICLVGRRSLRVPSVKAWAHVVVASILNVVGFSLFSAFAQIAAATSRVAILTYTMPIWTLVLAWLVLRERPSRVQAIAIALCVVGLAILIRPLATTGFRWDCCWRWVQVRAGRPARSI